MSLYPTMALLALGLALASWAAWQERRQRGLGELPLLPPIPILILGVIIMLVAAAHLVSLWTGVPLKSRFAR
jgi:hypothetical protein